MDASSTTAIELLNGQNGMRLHRPNVPSRLSKYSLASRYLALLGNYPNLSSIEKVTGKLTGELKAFQPYYRGLKVRSVSYRKVKFALQETMESSGLGSWCSTVVPLDMFPIKHLEKNIVVQALSNGKI